MQELKGRYQPASADIACEEFDGEMVILNLASGHYFALNRSAAALTTGLLQGFAIEALTSIEGAGFTAEQAAHFFKELTVHELVAPDHSNVPVPLDTVIRSSINGLTEPPTLEVHADLADLIIADPIHDSDESVGWPIQKAA